MRSESKTVAKEQGSEDQKPAVLIVEEMKILLVWWYGGIIFSFE